MRCRTQTPLAEQRIQNTHFIWEQQHLLTLHNVLTEHNALHTHTHTHTSMKTHAQKQWQRQIQHIIKQPRRWSLSSVSPSYTPSLSLSSCLPHFHVQYDNVAPRIKWLKIKLRLQSEQCGLLMNADKLNDWPLTICHMSVFQLDFYWCYVLPMFNKMSFSAVCNFIFLA